MTRVISGLLAFCGGASAGVQAATQTVIIDESARGQVIDHFGASDAWNTQVLAQWSVEGRNRFADLLFDRERGIGLSQWRFGISAGHQPDRVADPMRSAEGFEMAPGAYDWTRQPAQRWLLAAARSRGVERFLAYSYSGTPRMTPNGKVNPDPGPLTINLRPDAFDDYATYLADIVEYFARGAPPEERVTFDWLSPINEPQWKWDKANQEATRASNANLKRIYAAVGDELRRRRLPTRVHGVESGSIGDMCRPHPEMTAEFKTTYGDYVREFCGDATMAPILGRVISYHSYWSDRDDQISADRVLLKAAIAKHPEWKIWQTEYCRMEHARDVGMATALKVAEVIHADLSIVGVSAWDWWLALSRGDYKDGILYTDWKRPGDPETIVVPKVFWAFGHYSRFVRPGMVRVSCEASDGLLSTAFTGDGGARPLVVVLVNPTAQSRSVRLELKHARPDGLVGQVAYTTDERPDQNLRALAPSAFGEVVDVPARSLVTIVCE